MELEFEGIRLQKVAFISIAAYIWDKELARNEAKDLFYTEEALEFKKDKWYALVKKVIKSTPADLLPPTLHKELLYSIKYMGLRIYGWFDYLKKSPIFGPTASEILYENYTKKIYWTYYGTIDEIKIFKSFWLRNPNVDTCQMYNMACCYCLEEEVAVLWQKISESDKGERYRRDFIQEVTDLNILAYWDNIRNPSNSFISELRRASDRYQSFGYLGRTNQYVYNVSHSVEENMLRLCARNGYHIGFKYFWNRLNDKQKYDNILICFEIIFLSLSYFQYLNFFLYHRDTYTEICKFLLQNLFKTKTYRFVLNNVKIILLANIFGESRPWQELFFPFFSHLLLCLNAEIYVKLFSVLVSALEEEKLFFLPIENTQLERNLLKFWHVTPSRFKATVARELMPYFFNIWDLTVVKLILNDEDLSEDFKRSLLEESHKKFFSLIKNEDVNKIEQLFCQLLVPDNLDKKDVAVLEHIYKLLLRKNLISVDKFLKEHRSVYVIKKALKKELAIKYVTFYFVKKYELDSADEFLFWLLESPENVNDYKNFLENDEFSKDHVFAIWNASKESLELAISRSDNFLNWLTNHDEKKIREFKIKKLKEIEYAGFARLLIFKFREVRIVSDFLLWCSWTYSEIDLFKNILSVVSKEEVCAKILAFNTSNDDLCKKLRI